MSLKAIIAVLMMNWLVSGCSLGWQEFASNRSADGRVVVSLRRFYVFPDYSVSFEVKTDTFRKRVVVPGDRMPTRSEVYLGKEQVGIVICDAFTQPVQSSIHSLDGSEGRFEEVQERLSSQIVEKYHPTKEELVKFDFNVLKWYCGEEERLPDYRRPLGSRSPAPANKRLERTAEKRGRSTAGRYAHARCRLSS